VFPGAGGRRPVGEALLEQPVDGVFFTGSYATGASKIAAVVGRG
jgi:acyl-CoA reductase-like NAD-dependent aldehyde dehydrogenase